MASWLEDRLQLKTAFRNFLQEPLPERVGWPHVLGSILLALFGLQAITGILLSFFYATSPDGAYRSVRYITFESDSGEWLRSIHYWGASAMVIVVALHLIRTFLYAAYRKPREATWIVGVLLLLSVLAFAQTGYLLPWDQRAYWGTAVTVQIVATVPILGPKIAFLLQGGNQVGALTLSRFFSIHVVLLPLITVLLIGGHLYLIRRFGITAPWTAEENSPRTIPFYPYQMVKDAAAMLVVLAIVLILAAQISAPLGNPADPGDNTFAPRPDWYFLFLFQLLRYLPGKWEIVGTFILPAGFFLLLLALPFIDRNPSRRLGDRLPSLAFVLIAIAIWSSLTYASVRERRNPSSWRVPQGIAVARAERIKRPAEIGGLYLLKQYCFECHSLTMLGARKNLQMLVRSDFPSGGAWLNEHLQETKSAPPLSEKEVGELMAVMQLVGADDLKPLYTIPPKVRYGAHFFYSKACFGCHRIDGQGGKMNEVKAPDLTFRLLRPKQWHIEHIHDATSVVPNSKMPPFLHYEPYEYDALAEYILYLHTP